MPGLAAFVALIFSYQASKATDIQLQIAERGTITDRYNAAIANLGSRSSTSGSVASTPPGWAPVRLTTGVLERLGYEVTELRTFGADGPVSILVIR